MSSTLHTHDATQSLDLNDILSKLVQHIDPAKARIHFGPGYYFGPQAVAAVQPIPAANILAALKQQAQVGGGDVCG